MAATSAIRPAPGPFTETPESPQRRPPASETALSPRTPREGSSWTSPEVEGLTRLACATMMDTLQKVVVQAEEVLHSAHNRLLEGEREEMAGISDAGRRMLSIARSLHQCALIEQAGDWETVDCTDLLQQVTAGLEEAISETGACVSWRNLPRIRSIKPVLTVLFRELILNAINYRSADLPDIRIDAVPADKNWVFSVSDNGIGVPLRQRASVFEPFYRVDSRSWRPGLGLVVVRSAVQRLGGRIWLEGNDRGGSTFRFALSGSGAL